MVMQQPGLVLGANLGTERIVELAKDPSSNYRQLSYLAKGHGNFTSTLLKELASSCPNAESTVETFSELWSNNDSENPFPLGIMQATDVQVATDSLIRTLARCTGNCISCPFPEARSLTLDEAMAIEISDI